MIRDEEIIAFEAENKDMSIRQIARNLGACNSRISRLLYKHNLRSPKSETLDNNALLWNKIKHFLDTTKYPIKLIAEDLGVCRSVIISQAKLNGYSLKKRQTSIICQRTNSAELKKQWPEIKKQLDSSNVNLTDIAKQFNVSYNTLSNFLSEKRYDTQQRRNRLIEKNQKPKQQRTHYPIECKETLSGDAKSILAHRLPLNRIAEVFQ